MLLLLELSPSADLFFSVLSFFIHDFHHFLTFWAYTKTMLTLFWLNFGHIKVQWRFNCCVFLIIKLVLLGIIPWRKSGLVWGAVSIFGVGHISDRSFQSLSFVIFRWGYCCYMQWFKWGTRCEAPVLGMLELVNAWQTLPTVIHLPSPKCLALYLYHF